jgi:hypothetical protein
MATKLTTYDPAEDLASDAAIATFMAEAFASEDALTPWAWWRGRREWRRSPERPGCRASSYIVHSVRMAIPH